MYAAWEKLYFSQIFRSDLNLIRSDLKGNEIEISK